MFNFVAGHMCLWGRTADWTMLHVTTKMLAIKRGEEEVVPPTPMRFAHVADSDSDSDSEEWTIPNWLEALKHRMPEMD
jgi:hypothetical protein